VGPRASLDALMKRKNPRPHRKSNPRTPIVQPGTQGVLLEEANIKIFY